SLLRLTARPPAEIYPLSLHDALPISPHACLRAASGSVGRPRSAFTAEGARPADAAPGRHRSLSGLRDHDPDIPEACDAAQERRRSEEHTSELQSPDHLVCRLLLEKKK